MNLFKDIQNTGKVSINNPKTNNILFEFTISKNPFLKANEGEIIASLICDRIGNLKPEKVEIFLDDRASAESIGEISKTILKAIQEGKFRLIEGNQILYLLLSGNQFKEASEEDYQSLIEYIKKGETV